MGVYVSKLAFTAGSHRSKSLSIRVFVFLEKTWAKCGGFLFPELKMVSKYKFSYKNSDFMLTNPKKITERASI
jgi:hypothetical protein